MDEDEPMREEDFLEDSRNLSPVHDVDDLHYHDDGEGFESEIQEEEEEEEEEEEGEEEVVRSGVDWNLPPAQSSYKYKLMEILKNLQSPEFKIYSEASKEFIKLLNGDPNGEVLHEYVQSSPNCIELLEAWKLHEGKPGVAHVLSLISAILEHQYGKSRSSGINRNLDKFAHLMFKMKLDGIYAELNSHDHRRQSAVLYLLTSVVRRGMVLASEVAKSFDFRLPVLLKLSGTAKHKAVKEPRRGFRNSTRPAFVEFAMSFLEVGNPRLLRWMLQKRELYSGVLQGLMNDDECTVVHVLTTLRDKILIPVSFVPPALRSVLFGSITLELLTYISGNPEAGPAAKAAHEVLDMVCTDPCNGLMPSSTLKGNDKRLFELLKKLKATEVGYHRDLLLAIVKRRASLCAAYMEEFPYHLEPRPSPLWFAAISLAADMIASVDANALIASLASCPHDAPNENTDEVQCVLKCITPRSFARSVMNRGLLHTDRLVQHGSVRVLLESVKLFDRLLTTMDDNMAGVSEKHITDRSEEWLMNVYGVPGFSCFMHANSLLGADGISIADADDLGAQKWMSLKQYIRDEVRAVLPDPQVLLKLLSTSSNKQQKHPQMSLKRCSAQPECGSKKLKSDMSIADVDIVISGVDTELSVDASMNLKRPPGPFRKQELDVKNNHALTIAEIWGLSNHSIIANEPKDADNFFQSKLLDVLAIYLRTMPIALNLPFDFFKILLSDPLSLSIDQQHSLLSVLVEYVGQYSGSGISDGAPELMYKHLQPLINILVFSDVKDIRDLAYKLVRAAMISTGAFEQNLLEVDAWLLFLPGYERNKFLDNSGGAQVLHHLSAVVISFLCDAVSTIGNNFYKYVDQMRKLIFLLDDSKDCSPNFSPLIVCVLQKCLRVLESDSGTFKTHEKSMISIYVCNTLSLIFQTQIDMRMLLGLICSVLSEKFNNSCSVNKDSETLLCEWRPLKDLLVISYNILNRQRSNLFAVPESFPKGNNSSFQSLLAKVRECLGQDQNGGLVGVAVAFSSSVICASPGDLLGFLANVADQWPQMFFSGLEMVDGSLGSNCCYVDELSGTTAIRNADLLLCEESAAAAAAFSVFLKHIPFHVLFGAILSFGNPKMNSAKISNVLHSDKLLGLLKVKLSEGSIDERISFLQYLLFWTHQIYMCYRARPCEILEEISQICLHLLEYLIDQLTIADPAVLKTKGTSLFAKYVQDVVDLIFQHPVVILSLSQPLSWSKELPSESLEDGFNFFLAYSKKSCHPIDCGILQFLGKAIDWLLAYGNGRNSALEILPIPESVLKAPMLLVQSSLFLFKENFELFIRTQELATVLPRFYALYTLTRIISPLELLELVQWMFCKLQENGSMCMFASAPAVSVASCMGYVAVDVLFNNLQQPSLKLRSEVFYGSKCRRFNISTFQQVYYEILDFATCFKLKCLDACLLKAVRAVYGQRFAKCLPSFLLFYMLLTRMINNSPMKLLTHCLYPTSRIEAETLLWLIEVSSLHSRLFGKMFLDLLSKELSVANVLNSGGACPHKGKVKDENSVHILSENNFLLLLPAALSYLTSNFREDQKQDTILKAIPTFYSGILFAGFSDWKKYVSGSIFQEEFDDLESTTLEGISDIFSNSLLGKAVGMLRYFFVFSGSSLKKKRRLEIFDSIYPHSSVSDGLLDTDLKDFDAFVHSKSLKLVNQVVAKISFTWLLLFHPQNIHQLAGSDGDGSEEMSYQRESKRLNCAKLRFINILVHTLDHIVKKCPMKEVDNFEISHSTDCYHIFRYLEVFILKNIVQLSMAARSYLSHLPSLAFLTPFVTSSLLHRYEDPVRLRAIRCILVALSDGAFSSSKVLDLLLGHSKFVSLILCGDSVPDPSSLTSSETLLQPFPSILKSPDVAVDHSLPEGRSNSGVSLSLINRHGTVEIQRLELIKLLRALFYHKVKQKHIEHVYVAGMNARELLSLLLCGYGATLSVIDLEILHLMHEIELTEGSEYDIIGEMDFLWGASALKIKKEQTLDSSMLSNKTADCETVNDKHRRLFRENIPVNSKLCLKTVLHFCNERALRAAPMSMERLLQDNFLDATTQSRHSETVMVEQYDPAFILRFSIHSLSMGYIEPIEFSRLGLLAITLISLSSSNEEIRKLGYESLGLFKKALENYRDNNDTLRLQLLLTYLQNGISEPWQKIPSVTAIFASEASLVLLDPAQTHFLAMNKILMHSRRPKLKSIPLFDTLFESGSLDFKKDLWILQLLCAALNFNDNANIYRRNNLLELLLSFYASSLSNPESKILILQIVKKSVKLPMLAHYLVTECGLISWLSTLFSSSVERYNGGDKMFSLNVIELVLEIINVVISMRVITEWLQECALEQLSELSSCLHALLLSPLKLMKERVSLIKSVLKVIVATLKLSQKRKIYQPHFIFSVEGLLQLFQAISSQSDYMEDSLNIELGIVTVLMCAPMPVSSQMDRVKLSKLVMLVISATFRSSSDKCKGSDNDGVKRYEGQQREESLLSKLLRWVTAAIILGHVLDKSACVSTLLHVQTSRMTSLQSLVDLTREEDKNRENDYDINEALAVLLLYLQQLGKDFSSLRSVISALCFLLLSSDPESSGNEFLNENRELIAQLCSKIHCPIEANPAWRWSFYQPWRDLSASRTVIEEMEEEHACQSLLIIFSNALGGKSMWLSGLSYHEVEASGLFEWERENLLRSRT